MLWLSVLTAAASEPHQVTLDNGLTVTVVTDQAMPHLVVQHWIMSGSAADPLTHPGLAHLVEHVIVRDSGMEETIAALGGQLSAFTTPDYTRYSAQVAPADFSQTLQILAPISLTETTVASARRVVAEEFAQRGGYTARLRAAIDGAYWREHPYAAAARWMMVEPDNLTTADCAAFIEAHYRPDQTQLVVVGPLSEGDVLETVRDHYGKSGEENTVTRQHTHTPPEHIALSTGPAAVRLAGLIWPLPPTAHPDQPALQLALSGLPTAAPELMPGAMSAGGHVSWRADGSRLLLSGVYSALRSDTRIMTDLERAAERTGQWLTAARLEAFRRIQIRQLLGNRLDPNRLARELGWSAVMRGEVRATDAAVAALEALTVESVEAVWRRWISSADPIEVVVNVD
ncbi:MAG: pitrilysin family protein [Myxococcota bacterium]|nr:pitrilysin family protein [Myxococcota bacterium]